MSLRTTNSRRTDCTVASVLHYAVCHHTPEANFSEHSRASEEFKLETSPARPGHILSVTGSHEMNESVECDTPHETSTATLRPPHTGTYMRRFEQQVMTTNCVYADQSASYKHSEIIFTADKNRVTLL